MGQLSRKQQNIFFGSAGEQFPPQWSKLLFRFLFKYTTHGTLVTCPCWSPQGGLALVGTPWRVGDMGGETYLPLNYGILSQPQSIMEKKESD